MSSYKMRSNTDGNRMSILSSRRVQAGMRSLGAVVVLAAAHAAAELVNFSDSFESYAVGSDISANSSWGTSDGGTIVATSQNPSGYFEGYPITNSTHNGAMAFNNGATNVVQGVAQQNVFIDYLIKPTFSVDVPVLNENAQYGLYFDTDGVANLYHTYEETFCPWSVTQRWTSLTNLDPINEGDWARVTLQMFYDNPDYTYLKLWVNGEAVSSTFGYSDNTMLSTNGTYFINADCNGYGVTGENKINFVEIYGAGVLDDVVVTAGDIAPFEAIPEPATLGLMVVAGGVVYLRRRSKLRDFS